MLSYQEVAKEYELDRSTAIRFVEYMKARWGDIEDENIKCHVGYAGEWAKRFKQGREFECSDLEGQEILMLLGQ
jgi:hypothetical protein